MLAAELAEPARAAPVVKQPRNLAGIAQRLGAGVRLFDRLAQQVRAQYLLDFTFQHTHRLVVRRRIDRPESGLLGHSCGLAVQHNSRARQCSVQRLTCRRRRGIALFGIDRQQRLKNPVYVRRQIDAACRERDHRPELVVRMLGLLLPRERAREHEVEDHTQPEQVGERGHGRRRLGMLRREEAGRSHDHMRRRMALLRQARDAEIRQECSAARPCFKQDVARRHVAVDDMLAVREVQRRADLPEDVDRVLQTQPLVLFHQLAHGPARHELHDRVHEAAGLAVIIHRDDVGVAQAAGQIRLAAEARDALLILAQQHLDRDRALVQKAMATTPDLRRRAPAKLMLKNVVADAPWSIDHACFLFPIIPSTVGGGREPGLGV
ncbi:MAG: hypothetical protein AVDCRST_MAG26-1050 [uncultured Chloroflexia bacterium]|uniref:Uncharacterized protein n=1 Tax=uncultured Chloroflexia bacterium TaxID=1672391 RepID=A0A6J4HSQ3_9CHLR|nr:MAG: hypothetical protein AVDCRST_MAG26-1050 [uncultured Chloroflexia bacterium]